MGRIAREDNEERSGRQGNKMVQSLGLNPSSTTDHMRYLRHIMDPIRILVSLCIKWDYNIFYVRDLVSGLNEVIFIKFWYIETCACVK